MSDNIKVAVRVRPFNERELKAKSECILSMKGQETTLYNPKAKESNSYELKKKFIFDHSMWSLDRAAANYASQYDVFQNIGKEVLNASFEGYNACIFAYGQTGSGKSYTMMGTPGNEKEEGLIPRICNSLFQRIAIDSSDKVQFKTEISYFEIYNEKVRDLFASASNCKLNLKVREHPKTGPYVENLTSLIVSDFRAIQDWMEYGNTNRATASTLMNDVSSRSHAIFTIKLTIAQMFDDFPNEIVSRLHLIDLAGSERAASTGATDERLREGSSINKSLVTLGTVIQNLVVASNSNSKVYIRYRDSILTWLLKDSLGGNSKTFMIATLSPSALNYPEIMSTLNYANRAKMIKNKPEVNEDPNVKIIKDLKQEIEKLRSHIKDIQVCDTDVIKERDEMQIRLQEKELQINELSKAWTDKWKETQKAIEEQKMAITSEGLKLYLHSQLPHLIELDSSQSGLVIYNIKKGVVTLGPVTGENHSDIELDGFNIVMDHCIIHYEDDVNLVPKNGICIVNMNQITETTKLRNGDQLKLGHSKLLRFYNPLDRESPTSSSNSPELEDFDEESDLKRSSSDVSNELSAQEINEAVKSLMEDKDIEIHVLTQQVNDLQLACNRYRDQLDETSKLLNQDAISLFGNDSEVFKSNENIQLAVELEDNTENENIQLDVELEDNSENENIQLDVELEYNTENENNNIAKVNKIVRLSDGKFVTSKNYNCDEKLRTSPYHELFFVESDSDSADDIISSVVRETNMSRSSSYSALNTDTQMTYSRLISTSSNGEDSSTTPPDNSNNSSNSNNSKNKGPIVNRSYSQHDVRKIITEEKKKWQEDQKYVLFKLQREKEEMARQIRLLEAEKEKKNAVKSCFKLRSRSLITSSQHESVTEQVLITATIPETHLVRRNLFTSTFHVYYIHILLRDDESINIYRRYTEFKELHEHIVRLYTQESGKFELPPRKYIGYRQPTFVNQRKVQLEEYLNDVLSVLSLNPGALSTKDNNLPTKFTVMEFHQFFRETSTDMQLTKQSTTKTVSNYQLNMREFTS